MITIDNKLAKYPVGVVFRHDGHVTVRLPDDFYEQMETSMEQPIAFQAIDGGWLVRAFRSTH